MTKPKAIVKAVKKKVKATAGPADKAVALAALAAVGLTLGKDAVASTEQPLPRGSEAAELADAKSSQVEQASVESAEREPSEAGEVTADSAESGENTVALSGERPILLADASSALGVYSDMPLQLAQASPASSVNAAGAGGTAAPGAAAGAGAGAGAGGAGAAAEGAAAAAGSVGGLSAGFGAIGVAAVAGGLGGAGGAALAATTVATAATVTPAAAVGGLAAKGLLSGATVFYDFNGNGVFNAGVDPSATTDALGKYSINLTAAQKAKVETGLNDLGKELKLVVTGGTDTVSGLAFTGSLSSAASKDTAVEVKINAFTTMKAAGMSDAVLKEMLGGRDLDSLTSGDFDSADGVEAIAMKLWALVSDKVGGDADAAEAAMAAVSSVLEKLNAAGGDLNALLGDGGSLDATELENLFGSAIDKAVALYDDSVLNGTELTDEQLAAVMDDYADKLGSALDGFVDGNVSAQDLADFNALKAAADTAADATATNLANTDSDILAIAEKYHAQIGYDSNGDAVSFILDEADAQLLLDQGVVDPFAAFGSLDLILQVDGTLLGTEDNPLTIAGLQALGVDGLSDGTDSFAPYLHLTEGNFTNVASDIAFLSSIDVGAGDLASGNLPVYVDGTIYHDDMAAFDNLGVIGIDSSNHADVFDLLDGYSLHS
ncbi:MAG: hypothetical protein V4625_17050 [Pseudomonadota bacterium]